MWWCYFDWVHPATQHRLVAEPDPRRRSHLARDLFTLGHLPIVAGIVLVAAAVEEGLLHPTAELDSFGTLSLAAGTGLYLAGFVIGNLRATGRLLTERLVGLLAVTTWIVVAGPTVSATITVTGVALIVGAIATIETMRRNTGPDVGPEDSSPPASSSPPQMDGAAPGLRHRGDRVRRPRSNPPPTGTGCGW